MNLEMLKRIRVATVLLALCLAPSMAGAQQNPYPADKPSSLLYEQDSAWKSRHEAILAQVKQNKDAQVIFIGDSITHFWESAGKDVWARYYAPRKAINMGISGDKVQFCMWRLENGELDGIQPKVAVIMIGTNNCWGDEFPVDQTVAGLKMLVQKVRAKLPNTKILLLGIFPRGDLPGSSQNKPAEINKAISKLNDARTIFYLDIGKQFLDDKGNLGPGLSGDRLHLSAQGYQIWAQSIEPKLAQLLRQRPIEPPKPATAVPTDGYMGEAPYKARHEAIVARVKQSKDVDLIFVGDSITHFWENEGKDVWAKYYAGRKALNLGISGDRTQSCLWRLDHGELDGLHPKVAVVLIGTNNTWGEEFSAQDGAMGVKAVVDYLRKKLPTTQILLLGLLPREDWNTNGKWKKVNDIVKQMKFDKNVTYMDIGSRFTDDKGAIARGFAGDRLHLATDGYRIWADAIEPTLAKMLGTTPIKTDAQAAPK